MAKKISELPPLENTASTNLMEISEGGVSYRMDRTTFISGIAEEANEATPTEVNGTSHTLGTSDEILLCNNTSTQTITVPANASVAIPVGRLIQVFRLGDGNVDISAAGGVTVNTDRGLSVVDKNAGGWLRKTDTDTWYFNSGSPFSIVTTVAGTTDTIEAEEAGGFRKYTSSSAVTVTFSDTSRLPSNGEVTLRKAGTGAVTVQRAGSTITFNGATSFGLTGTAVVKREGSGTDYLVEGETDETTTFDGDVDFANGATVTFEGDVDFDVAGGATAEIDGNPIVSASASSGNDIARFTGSGAVVEGNNTLIWNESAGLLEMYKENAGNGADPTLRLTRESSTPADDDAAGQIEFNYYDDASPTQLEVTVAQINSYVPDVSTTTVDGQLDFVTSVNGTLTVQLRIADNKLYMFNLPTSDPVSAGQIWSDSGTLKVSSG